MFVSHLARAIVLWEILGDPERFELFGFESIEDWEWILNEACLAVEMDNLQR